VRSGDPVAYRNGYEPRAVKTTSGPLELKRPRLRNASELGFCSRNTGCLESERTGRLRAGGPAVMS
jgi:hypothetical protein